MVSVYLLFTVEEGFSNYNDSLLGLVASKLLLIWLHYYHIKFINKKNQFKYQDICVLTGHWHTLVGALGFVYFCRLCQVHFQVVSFVQLFACCVRYLRFFYTHSQANIIETC
jgi:hypothetical protein